MSGTAIAVVGALGTTGRAVTTHLGAHRAHRGAPMVLLGRRAEELTALATSVAEPPRPVRWTSRASAT